MKKYETDFKLKVVKSFLARDGGEKLQVQQWSVPEEKIRTLVCTTGCTEFCEFGARSSQVDSLCST